MYRDWLWLLSFYSAGKDDHALMALQESIFVFFRCFFRKCVHPMTFINLISGCLILYVYHLSTIWLLTNELQNDIPAFFTKRSLFSSSSLGIPPLHGPSSAYRDFSVSGRSLTKIKRDILSLSTCNDPNTMHQHENKLSVAGTKITAN